MGDELVETYLINGRRISIYGCWDDGTPEGEYDFYDIYEDQDGEAVCLNIGNPFYADEGLPSKEDIEEFLETL